MELGANYERIQTLAKKEYEKRIKEYHLTDIDEAIYWAGDYRNLTPYGIQHHTAMRFFKPLLLQYKENPEQCISTLNKYCGEGTFDIQIEPFEEERERFIDFAGKSKAVGDLLKVTFSITEEKRTNVYGFTGYKKYGDNFVMKKQRQINIVHLPAFFAGLYWYWEIRKVITGLCDMSPAQRKENRYYQCAMQYFADAREPFSNDFKFPVEEAQFERFMGVLASEIPSYPYIDFVKYNTSDDTGWRMFECRLIPGHLKSILKEIVKDRGAVVQNVKSYQITTSEYTKSFQTKKTQSKKLKEDIAQSRLWNCYGYVEYDESIDLQKIERYEKEFEAFYDTHLNHLDLSQNAIRFRKLGQHKAAGLYYPAVKCLCVDVNYPYSFMHELGHLIDYQFGGLSAQTEFKAVYQAAQEYIEDLESADEEIAAQLKKKSKYNKEYYLYPAEVFARSFELFVYYIWGERTSLQSESFSAIYDCSSKNLQLLEEYFEQNVINNF